MLVVTTMSAVPAMFVGFMSIGFVGRLFRLVCGRWLGLGARRSGFRNAGAWLGVGALVGALFASAVWFET